MSSETTRLLIDCGLAAREVEARLESIGVSPVSLDGILISHAHIDHIRAAGTIHARHGVPVFAEEGTLEAIRARPDGGASFARVRRCGAASERIGDIAIETMAVPHGGKEAGEPVCFRLESGGASVGHMTDLGQVPPTVLDGMCGVKCAVIEANYHQPTVRRKLSDTWFMADWDYLRWVDSDTGHLSNEQCGAAVAALAEGGAEDIFLAHMSENHHEPEKDNNDFFTARKVVATALAREGVPPPRIHKTYRRGLTEGRPSEVVEVR